MTRHEKADRGQLRPTVLMIVLALALAISASVWRVPAYGSGIDPIAKTRAAVIWAVGDGDGSTASAMVTNLVVRGEPARFLYLGDVYEYGSASDYASNYAPTFGRLAELTAPTPGNHEWPLHAEGYDVYWRTVTGRSIPAFYRFSVGGWEILSLNSEAPHDPWSPQLRWLQEQVRRPGTCRLAFWHRPRYSGGGNSDQPDVAPLWNALRRRASIVLNGHDHSMQRLKPRDGITEFITGAGGHERHNTWGDSRVAFANNRDWGALRLRLEPGRASYRFVAVDGRTLDSGKVNCRRVAFSSKRSESHRRAR